MKGFRGFLLTVVLAAVMAAAGCATTAPPPNTTAFTGEVWTWDEQTNTVTLRQAGRDIRVQVSADQLIGLQLHQTRTIYGVLAPPAELPMIVVEGTSTVVPRGPADEMEVSGNVAALDPAGRVTVSSPQGTVQVWRAIDGLPFTPGTRARVRMRVQPLDVVLIRPGQPAPPAIDPSASPRTEVGDYAVVIGRILAVDPAGGLVIDSPRGPVNVRVLTPGRYRVNDTVEVRTSIHPMP